MEGQDYIVSELLSELKEENKRKDAQIRVLHKSIMRIAIAAIFAIILIIGACLLYLNQYDFSGPETWSTEKTAEGVFAIIDSDGNLIGYDTAEGVDQLGEGNNQNNENDFEQP